jgi:DNA-binding protein HU-beta
MNKGELVSAISKKTGSTQKDVETIISTTLAVITEAVAGGERVTLVGFGTFESRQRKEREGRNPATGKTIKIPATTVPAFSAGKQFKEKISGAS